ncbi:hypothetical protein DFH08DRAFT_818372 [Mycena albidolilacea]|uniref:Uncharacterized protein n=1 Tax=Mycena albidolilacea TaxID=1033008 RepID=A0AAD6ZH42_9AGAR|nr:hypothetical protein DFH08DRAFT_818372 [Mycena albidolilacea]
MGEARVLGRKFSVTRMLWLRDKKRAFTLKADDMYNPLERFETDSTKMQGQLADLRNILPEALRDKMGDMEENGLADEFRAGMGEQRSQISTRIHRTSGPEISTAHRKIYCPAIHVVRTSSASRLAGSATTTPLAAIFASIVRGPSAVALLKDHKNPVVQAETNDQIWGLQSEDTTAGDIAALVIARVQSRFALSADDSLRKNSKVTGINWAADYELYLKYLTTGLEKCNTSVLKIFRMWDDIFFPGRSDASGGAENNGGSTVDAMDLLNADAEEEPEDGGENEEKHAG